ncbi:MAG TPA: ABC transporter ATP-binding protein [Xanthobacteraceae bacterium]|nr:ABC transporter ATP-binding protein [Xanthobacteraceae bacterium]
MLTLTNVVAGYGAGDVLKGITIEIAAGEIVAIIGANGAGKTTTMRVITGLLRPRSGSIRFEGEPIDRTSAFRIARAGVALVPEGRRIFHGMTVEENLELGALKGDLLRAQANGLDSVYDMFPRLAERRHQIAGSLSGGEQQMLALGRALLSKPKLLLLDEPSLGLAPMVVRQIFNGIAQIHREGMTVLLVEQNVNLALETASRAYVLQTGRVAIEGPVNALKSDPLVQRAYLGRELASAE